MENKYKLFFVFLSFLPILVYPISFPISLLLAVSLMVVGFTLIKDEDTTKSMLHPLTLVLVVGAAFLSLNFAVEIIHAFGGMFAGYLFSGFRFFLNSALSFVHAICLLTLLGGVVMIFVFGKTNNRVPVLSDLIDSILTGNSHFKTTKTKTKSTKTKSTKTKKDKKDSSEDAEAEDKE